MVVDAALLERAADLKGALVAFSQRPRYERAASAFLAEHGAGSAKIDELTLILIWDSFVLEHKLRNGRRIVEQFVAANPALSEAERQMVLGWQDVVQGPFEVLRHDGPALMAQSLVDDMTYRVRSNMGPAVFRQMPRGSFIIARMVAVGDEWMKPRNGSTPTTRSAARRSPARTRTACHPGWRWSCHPTWSSRTR